MFALRWLGSLPKELGDTYDQAMQRIKGQDEEEASLALRVLSYGKYAFQNALMSNHAEMISLFLAHGVTYDTCYDDGSMLHCAAEFGILDLVKKLVTMGVDISGVNS